MCVWCRTIMLRVKNRQSLSPCHHQIKVRVGPEGGKRMMEGGKGRDKSEWHHLYQTSSPQSHHSKAVHYHLVLYIIDLSLFSVYLIVITDR